MAIEDVLTKQVEAVVGGSKYEDLVYDLVSDVLYFPSWYGVNNPNEVQVDFGTSIGNLVNGDAQRQLLSKTIRRFVLDNSDNTVNADEVTRLALERIVNWERWYPVWYEDQNFKAYAEEEDEYNSVYDSDYGLGDNGIGDYF